jgi:glycosyltransferase involved in cell wall biosynthesis
MSGAARVTVVIPTRNRLAFLKEAVKSVEDQTLREWRLVIVDDASEDETWSWLQGQSDPRVSCVRLETRGERSAARNRGLAESPTEFVLFLDDDDRLAPFALEHLLAEVGGDTEVVAAVGGFEYFDDEGNHLLGPHPRRRFKRQVWVDAVWGWFVHSGRVLLRTEVARKAEGFTPGLVVGEDRDLWLRVARTGPMVFVPDAVLAHRVHAGQWRPLDVRNTELQITMRHLASLPPQDQRLGERIVAARTHFDQGVDAWEEMRYRHALRAFAELRSAPPSLLLSPLVRGTWFPLFWRALIASLIGPRAVATVLRIKANARRITGREAARWDVPFPKETARDDG